MSESLSQKTLNNSAYGLISFLWPILFTVFVTPIVVQKLGVADFGIYVLMLTVTSLLNLLDLGFAASFIKFMSEAHMIGDNNRMSRIISSALFINILIGVTGFALIILLAEFAMSVFKIGSAHYAQIKPVFYLTGTSFLLNSITATYTELFQAMQRFDLQTRVNIAGTTFLNAGILVVALLGYKLKAVMGIYLIFSLLSLILSYLYARPLMQQVKIKIILFRDVFLPALKFGSYMFANNLANTALLQLDKMILGMFAGPSLVSYYALPGNISSKTLGITSGLGVVLFPVMSGLSAAGEEERIKFIYLRSVRNALLLITAITVPILIFSKQMLFYWLGPDFVNQSLPILHILTVTYFFLAIFIPVSYYLAGTGKVKLLTLSSVSMAALNIIFMLILIPRYSITGAAVAYLLSVVVVPVVMVYIEARYVKTGNALRRYFLLLFKLAVSSVVTYVFSMAVLMPFVKNIYTLLVLGPLSVLAFLFLYKIMRFMEPEDEAVFDQFISNIKKKVARV